MPEPEESVRCPQCGRLVPVPPDWRLVICPGCGGVVSRMTSDERFD